MNYYPEIINLVKQNQELIDENRFEELYWKVAHLPTTNIISNLTKLLLNAEINFLSYMPYIPQECFKSLKITNFKIPESIKQIKNNSFALSSIQDIEIPSSVDYIGRAAFYGCKELKSISIPGSVINIMDSVFEDCTNLEKVGLNEGIKSIGAYSFEGTAIKEIILPNSLDALDRKVFAECPLLKSITFGSSIRYIGEDMFSNFGTEMHINYNNTMYAWSKVEVHGNNNIIRKTTIHCTDGDYNMGGTK